MIMRFHLEYRLIRRGWLLQGEPNNKHWTDIYRGELLSGQPGVLDMVLSPLFPR